MRASVERDLRGMEAARPGVSGSAEAALALTLSAYLDDPGTSPNAAAQLAKELRDTLALLRALAPARVESPVDEIRARRAGRLAEAEGKGRARRRGAS